MSESEESDTWFDSERVQSVLQEALDETDYEIYRVLNEDGRISDTELGERIGLSRTAARRRRKQLQEEGVVKVLSVLVLQNADLAYADVRTSLVPGAPSGEVDAFVSDLVDEELIYEIDEYLGEWDYLVRTWHADLASLKRYVEELFGGEAIVDDYVVEPVVRTQKAWHQVLDDPTVD